VLSHLAADSPDELARLAMLGETELHIHQAVGMMAVQLSLPVADAFASLRARADAEGRPISAVAADVVDRRRRFEP
jgi:hypothetical protein